MKHIEKNLYLFGRALARLSEAIDEYKRSGNAVIRDGMLQRFEFTTYLAWKSTKDYLILQGNDVGDNPKDIMRTAYLMRIVDDSFGWDRLLSDRRSTANAYDGIADAISTRVCELYVSLLHDLLGILQVKSREQLESR